MNFHLSPGWLHDTLSEVVDEGRAGHTQAREIGARREGSGRVHLGESRPVRSTWATAGGVRYGDALARVMARCGLAGAPRVLRQRHRRADPRPRGESARTPPRRGGTRGGVPGRVRHRACRTATTGPTTSDRGRTVGRRDRILDQHPQPRSSRSGIVFDEWYSQASVEESGALARDDRAARQQGPRLRSRTERCGSGRLGLGDNRDRVPCEVRMETPPISAGDLAYHRDRIPRAELRPCRRHLRRRPSPSVLDRQAEVGNIRARKSSVLARPYIARLRVFSRLICPSVWPLLQPSVNAFVTASTSRRKSCARSAALRKFPIVARHRARRRISECLCFEECLGIAWRADAWR